MNLSSETFLWEMMVIKTYFLVNFISDSNETECFFQWLLFAPKPDNNYILTFLSFFYISGTADAYVFATPGTKKWDTCAPEAILTALGGCMTDILNEQIDYSKTDKKYLMNWTGLLCANRNHTKFAHQVPEEVKKNLRETRDAKIKQF